MKRFLEEEKIEGEKELVLPSVGEERTGEHTKTGKKTVGEEKRQVTDFKEIAWCSSVVVQGGSTAKKWFV